MLFQKLLSDVTDANTEAPAAIVALLPVTLLQTNLLTGLGRLRNGPAPVALTAARLHEDGRGLGLGHFVEEGEVGHILPVGAEGDDRGELVAPQDLVGQVGRANLAGGGSRFHRGVHDHHQLEVGQLWVCPAAPLVGPGAQRAGVVDHVVEGEGEDEEGAVAGGVHTKGNISLVQTHRLALFGQGGLQQFSSHLAADEQTLAHVGDSDH